jgi:NMD protein affecting ribosome stability and mRNA decay
MIDIRVAICPHCGAELERLFLHDGTPDNLFECRRCEYPWNRWVRSNEGEIKLPVVSV